MRLLIVILAQSACTASESPEQHLKALDAEAGSTGNVCGGYATTEDLCFGEAKAQQALECMNGALTSGAVAEFAVSSLDDDRFALDTYMFTVDHEVSVFELHPEADGTHDMPYTDERPTCGGPFHLVQGMCAGNVPTAFLVLDGCPQ
jgi:hypothetical protein